MNGKSGLTSSSFQTYAEAVDWITGLQPFGIRPGLKRMETFMEKLDHPERRLKFIHVAGTNGKGSTCAFLTKVLRRNGYDVGTFTSPYIEKFTDRLRYNEEDIGEEDLLRLANRLKPLAEEMAASELGHPTMFEFTTALAILYFATVVYPDYVVWETGLGGRLDSTNIVNPVLSVITNVGHDHMDVLGNTLDRIALEKAGIIKAGVPLVSAVEQPEALEAIEQVCRDKKSTHYWLGRDFEYQVVSSELNRQQFDFRGPFREMTGLTISLNGYHQYKNAAVALMVIEVLRQYYALIVEKEDLYAALAETVWPGRLEMVSDHPPLLLDGAHNPEGAATLAEALASVYKYRKLHLMIGMLSTKEHSDYFRHILPLADTVILTEPNFRKKQSAEALAVKAREVLQEQNREIEITVEPDWKKALEMLLSRTGPEDLAVVSGTLYLISDVRSWILFESESEKGW
ncbi:bifunctional folylpolyglutamate synthase/dihydrofolate synthase [Paenibacillus sp. J2TS4]|nr:folylpolyglutamate synthase/dihydrofolate synthase family protein [Paenibacillus sp. J2TS4]GIP31357.1 bifunctional folylpolyglutamate synthase/dihydrofolate synthase [Paenibacillus sp. J2TS4]